MNRGLTVSGSERESWYATHPEHKVRVTVGGDRITAVFKGKTIADSDRVLVLHESRHGPVYYFPRESVQMGYLERTDHHTYCPFKGEASYWTMGVNGRISENAAWSYEDPLVEVADIENCVAFYQDKMDAWYINGEPFDPAVRK